MAYRSRMKRKDDDCEVLMTTNKEGDLGMLSSSQREALDLQFWTF